MAAFARRPIGEVIEFSQYGLSLAASATGTHSIVGMKDIQDGRVRVDEHVRVTLSEAEAGRFLLQPGDVLLNRTNSNELVGKCAIFDRTREAVFASYLVRLRFRSDQIVPAFANYYLNSEFGQSQLKVLATRGVSQANINPSTFAAHFTIPVPPLDEQRRIVAVLDAWDRQLALTQSRHMASSSRYDGLLQQFMRPVELRRASGWRRVLMADAFSERDERSDALPLLAITSADGVVPRDSLDRRDTASEDKSNYKVIRKGDIGYNTMRMWQGVFGLSRYNGIVSPAYTVITPNTDVIDAAFAAHLFAHPRVIHMFHRYSQGLVDDTLMLKFPHFSEIRLPLPDLWTQKAIAKALDAVQLEIGKRAELVQAVERQKRGLMQLLLSGEKRLLRDLPGMEAAA